jgi:glycosyltransferase involved in cell wall biosynthesis
MRLLIVYPQVAFYGGAELVVVRFCNYLTSRGISNALLTTSITPEVEQDLSGTEIIIAPVTIDRLYTKYFALLQVLRRVQHRFDVINCHNFPAELLSVFASRPVVWLCNEPELYLIATSGSLSLFRKAAFKLFLAFGKWVVRSRIAISIVADEGNAARFKEIYGVEPEIINYGIDHDFFSRPPIENIREHYGLTSKFLLLHTGTLTPYKNQMASLMTVQRLRRDIPTIHLILAGTGEDEYRDKLEQYIADNGLAGHVTFTGHVDRNTMRSLYHSADVLIHPVAAQGGWLAPFEALSTELPVIVSAELMAAAIISSNNIGVVTADYAGAVRNCFNNPEKYLAMAQSGKLWVQRNLDWEVFSGKLHDKCMRVAKRHTG